ncbi:MAG: ATP-binding cassette domain-containing protein, partial [Candidatus Riflebacteria bacterium]|nr:ATP-binding cassette domain-containing protein [Candidatus Riflebacteria bacterium]
MSKDHGAPGIATHGLSRRFGRVWAVRDVELKVPGGLITGFVGPNGAGKTTTLRMICGLIRPSSGEVSIGGKRLFYGPDSIPFRVRALVERPAFYESLTAFENLYLLARCTAGLTRNEVGEALKALGLTEAADRKVEGFS